GAADDERCRAIARCRDLGNLPGPSHVPLERDREAAILADALPLGLAVIELGEVEASVRSAGTRDYESQTYGSKITPAEEKRVAEAPASARLHDTRVRVGIEAV